MDTSVEVKAAAKAAVSAPKLSALEIGLVQESWRWIFFDRSLQETAVCFFVDYYFKQNPDCLAMFGLRSADDRNDAFSVHSLTVMHAIKYAVENLDNPAQFQSLFRTVGQQHVRSAIELANKHVESFLHQWIVFLRASNAKVFDTATVAAWQAAGQVMIEFIFDGMHPKTTAASEKLSLPPTPAVVKGSL